MASASELQYIITAKNLASKVFKEVEGDLKRFGKASVSASQQFARGFLVVGTAATAGIGVAIKEMVKFDDAFSGIRNTYRCYWVIQNRRTGRTVRHS